MISIRSLSFAYRKTRLYDRFDLALAAPGVDGLFGRNGSGQRLLLQLLAGLPLPRPARLHPASARPTRRRAQIPTMSSGMPA